MTAARLIFRGLVHHWRMHAGMALGAALAAALLTGSLLVGDSVRFSLERLASSRLGNVAAAVLPGEHFFRESLSGELAARVGPTAPALALRGSVALPDGRARANDARVLGVDARFWKLGGTADPFPNPASDPVCAANDVLAARLGLKPGDSVIVRVEEPSALSRDAPLSGAADRSLAIRCRVVAVPGADHFGRFGLEANQAPPLTVFLPLSVLQRELKKPGRANLLLAASGDVPALNAALQNAWRLADADLEIRPLPAGLELRTNRVFLEPALADAARAASPEASGVLTYLVNEIRLGSKATPYSMVTATDHPPGAPSLSDDEIAINTWLADDLGAKPGDRLNLCFFTVGDDRRLSESTRSFTVRAVLPPDRPDWMPPFPGLADVDNCRDWEPGIPIDTKLIRPKDEEYWKVHRGTPKAFVNLRAGQAAWRNRFGNLTALRFPPGDPEALERSIRARINPARAGLFFQPVRAAGKKAGRESEDFGRLFLGFGFFLIAAALLLMALLFVLQLQQRAAETGLLLALGFPPARVRRLLLLEGLAVAGLGTIAGAAAGALYTRLALHGLATVWRSAVNLSEFQFHAEPQTFAIGIVASLATGAFATWLAGRGQARQPAVRRMAGDTGPEMTAGGSRWRASVIVVSLVGAAGLMRMGGPPGFFGGGALLLIAGIGLADALLARLARAPGPDLRLAAIGMRAAARRRGRSLATVAVLASGIFLTIATGAFRQNPQERARERASGTGGFALFGQAALPVYEDLDTEEGRRALGLTAESTRGMHCVGIRLKDGDEASCLNLNRAQQPRFFGVRPEALATRGAFTFTAGATSGSSGWNLLNRTQPDGAIPAVGDENTVQWALGRSVGDTLEAVDERGTAFRVRIVGTIAGSILQGGLVLAERDFTARFPSATGKRLFLIDAPFDTAGETAAALSTAMESNGLDVAPAWRRLAEFQAVENGYLSIFQALGGLGLLLGSAGLGIVVLRNVMERRSELALLQAVGFSPGTIRRLVVWEYGLLVVLGTAIGAISAWVAVWPALLASGTRGTLGLPLLILLTAAGVIWSRLAAGIALRGPLLDALRRE